jgi:hypothetical protein
MKTEMKMMDNGNYERVVSPVQHQCRSKDHSWNCIEYGWKMGEILLKIEEGDGYEDGCQHEIVISFCPFCGYQPERSKREDDNGVYVRFTGKCMDNFTDDLKIDIDCRCGALNTMET